MPPPHLLGSRWAKAGPAIYPRLPAATGTQHKQIKLLSGQVCVFPLVCVPPVPPTPRPGCLVCRPGGLGRQGQGQEKRGAVVSEPAPQAGQLRYSWTGLPMSWQRLEMGTDLLHPETTLSAFSLLLGTAPPPQPPAPARPPRTSMSLPKSQSIRGDQSPFLPFPAPSTRTSRLRFKGDLWTPLPPASQQRGPPRG